MKPHGFDRISCTLGLCSIFAGALVTLQQLGWWDSYSPATELAAALAVLAIAVIGLWPRGKAPTELGVSAVSDTPGAAINRLAAGVELGSAGEESEALPRLAGEESDKSVQRRRVTRSPLE